MSDKYNPKFRVKFLRNATIDRTAVEPGNLIVDMDNKAVYIDILNANNVCERVDISGSSNGIRYMGSVPTVNDLPNNPKNGDMWNITADDSNYVWSDLENRWDKVGGGTIDLSNYYTKTQCDNKFLTEHQSLSNYYTKTQCDNKFLTSHQSLSNYYTKSECDSTFVTEAQILDLIDQLDAEIPS